MLSVSEFKLNKHLFYQLTVAIVVFTILIFSVGWKEIYWIYGAIILFSFFLSRFIYLSYFSSKINKSFLYFDENVIIKKDLDFIEIYPLNQLSAVNFANAQGENFVMIKLSFGNETMFFPYERAFKNVLERFARNITVSANAKKRGILSNRFPFSNQIQDLLYLHENSKASKNKFKFIAISVIISSLILIIAVPYFLDWNSFREAKKINTSTSFRNYIKEDRNHLYKISAKEKIKGKYDEAINIYNKTNADDKSAIIKILQYLKDNEIYYVDILFQNDNRIRDISKNYDVRIRSAENSFTTTKNKDREKELISTLNKTLGSIFPSDIICIEEITDRKNVPRIEIIYSYTNSEEGSLYYPVAQENINEYQRDYYYGLTIYWHFKLFVPTEKNSIYSFTLKSNPAVQFSAETSNTDNVYSNMVYSAFKDFDTEFKKHFLGD
ncbi:MAG: hypothetical protein EOL97_14790 [Spirochaetia bacterium]|nr:hypothetical protein [Spirochaetia bacterium]